ncbi:4-hydroxy-tetrahydrodipicolinate synthase [Terasakiispira papahanaumokuakeensis]|uniref:4-hydroxy-tetrahydrodipicolinate synthase n=1 Tax=Terasakiispira papahanaumokuakeensis TaxID=197479 RepID=A0A1E2V6H7_9GAMM|nr:4-hydroxy-tetrahydrodipicolinate synthase [Terasakiispira papahanaumokuakeensis]ODC02599.1 4-hydroxy-tetrahydrodipicolinate synthase [Terasakiispira papahanaumokuakeensis]
MFQGSIVALITPMTTEGEVDWVALDRLVDFHLEHETDAIVAAGTTGEPSTLSFAEHFDVIRRVIERVKGRIPVIAGTGANNTAEAVELTRYAAKVGADYCLSATPYYNKPTQEGLYQHYKAIAEASDLPIILYNVPGRTAVDMHNETVLRLTQVDNIVALKDATGDLERGKALIDAVAGTDFRIYSGDDATACELILMGAHGDISVTANVAPNQMHEMCVAALKGDAARAHQINTRLMPLHTGLFVESSPIPVKWAVQAMGLVEGGIRLPLTPLSDKYHPTVREALQLAGVLEA